MTKTERGKQLFRQQCASCHSLAAVNARGVTGPNLDEIGEVTPERIHNAIRNGGTGQGRMPAGLLRARRRATWPSTSPRSPGSWRDYAPVRVSASNRRSPDRDAGEPKAERPGANRSHTCAVAQLFQREPVS